MPGMSNMKLSKSVGVTPQLDPQAVAEFLLVVFAWPRCVLSRLRQVSLKEWEQKVDRMSNRHCHVTVATTGDAPGTCLGTK